MSNILRHDDTSISNDQEQVNQPEKKTNASSASHQNNADTETIRNSETFENFENDVNKSHARQHSEFQNKEERDRSLSRVSQVIAVNDVDRGSRASIQSQTGSIVPEDKDGTDAESDSETAVSANEVNPKEEHEQTRSIFKLKREQSVELETKLSGKTEKFIKDSGEPTENKNEEKVKHMKYTDGKQEDTTDVCDMRDNFPPVSHHDWWEHAQENNLDKQRNDDSDLSVTNTAEKDGKEGVNGSQGSMKEASTVSQRKNESCNDSERDIAIDLRKGNKVVVKPGTPSDDSNRQGEKEIDSGSEKGIIGTISRNNANFSSANITDPSTTRRISDDDNEEVNEAKSETTFGIVEDEHREEGRISDDKDLNTGHDGSRLLENQAMATPVSKADENVRNDQEDESLRKTRYVCENSSSNMKTPPVDTELIEGGEIIKVANPIRSENQKENNCLENHENEGSSYSDTSGYSWGKKEYRRNETDHVSDSHDTKMEQNYQENAKSVDAGKYGVKYPGSNEADKEKDGEDNAFVPQVESDDSNENDESKAGYEEDMKERNENENLPKGSLTTILVSREVEERKRQGNGYEKDKKNTKRGETKVKYRISRGEKKKDDNERHSLNYEEGRRIGGAAIAPFTKQYKHKKHIEHVLEDDSYRSNGETKRKRKPDESVVFDPHAGKVSSRSQRGRLFRVPRLKRNEQGRPIGGYYDDPFGPTEQEEVEAELATLDYCIDFNNISGKRTSSSRQYLRARSARDVKKEDAMTEKTVVFDVPEEGEAMSMDGSDLSELRTRGQRDITSAMRRKLRDRLFTRSKERGESAPNNLPLGCTTKHGWVQMDSNTIETDERGIHGGGRLLLNPLVRVYRQKSPTWSSGTSLSSQGRHAGGPYRRSIGEHSFDMEQQSVFEQGLETDRKVLHIAVEQKMSTNEHNIRAGYHAYYGTHDHVADEMEDFDENGYPQQLPTDTYNKSSTYLSDDGRLIVREKGCTDLKPGTASTWDHQTGGYGASLSHPSSASVRLQNNHSHIMESDKRLLQNRGDTYEQNMTVRSTYLNSTRLSADSRLRCLLEELFSDKKYLDHLIETTEPTSDTLMITRGMAEHGREFLMERADFWEETGPLPPRPALIQYGSRKSRAQTSFREDTISISTFTPDIRPRTMPVTLQGSVPSEKGSRKYSIQ